MSSLKAAKVLVARLKEKNSELDANIMHACVCVFARPGNFLVTSLFV